MQNTLVNKKANFGTLPVFTTAITTILGAILFLRFGYAVGNVGFIGVIGIIVLGHLVTIPTAFAVAEIATNQRVQGGGAYYIISRSFGLNVGAAIGIALYLSQAISIAFYVIAFAEAFDPLLNFISQKINIEHIDKRFISIPTMSYLSYLIIRRSANVGMKTLYIVSFILFTSLLFFFLGNRTPDAPISFELNNRVSNPDDFFYVFTIIFPAFTGLAAGLGLSGDLKDPTTSIPKGTLWATFAGLVIYLGVTYKMTISASPAELANDQLIMQDIALWGPIIPIGLAAASLSSALGSVLVAPRTLQAIGADQVIPNSTVNNWMAKGKPVSNEPTNAALVSIAISFFFIIIGDIDFVAKIISMFFMVTYGAICLISFLEHFAADPSYRPTFRSKWYYSLAGTLFSFYLMFKMNSSYALASLVIMSFLYYIISLNAPERRGIGKLIRGVIFQLSRQLQVLAQRVDIEDLEKNWRPFIVCVSKDTFKRKSAFDFLRWISYKYGFGTYIHFIEGYLSKEKNHESKQVLDKLIEIASGSKSNIYLDTIISPSYTSAIAQIIQLSGLSGKGNNMILFEFSRTDPDTLQDPLKNYSLLHSTGFDICVLNTSYKGFGYKKEIHIWITSYDYENANLMILLGYIILGHPEWKKGFIKIFALYNKEELDSKRENLLKLIKSGRLPISPSNIQLIPRDESKDPRKLISEYSVDADLTIVGFRSEMVKPKGISIFTGYNDTGNILFVNSNKEKEITLIT